MFLFNSTINECIQFFFIRHGHMRMTKNKYLKRFYDIYTDEYITNIWVRLFLKTCRVASSSSLCYRLPLRARDLRSRRRLNSDKQHQFLVLHSTILLRSVIHIISTTRSCLLGFCMRMVHAMHDSSFIFLSFFFVFWLAVYIYEFA